MHWFTYYDLCFPHVHGRPRRVRTTHRFATFICDDAIWTLPQVAARHRRPQTQTTHTHNVHRRADVLSLDSESFASAGTGSAATSFSPFTPTPASTSESATCLSPTLIAAHSRSFPCWHEHNQAMLPHKNSARTVSAAFMFALISINFIAISARPLLMARANAGFPTCATTRNCSQTCCKTGFRCANLISRVHVRVHLNELHRNLRLTILDREY